MTERRWYQSLTVQLAALTTLALFPLGAVAVFQTTQVTDEARESASLALLALTEQAARSEQLIIERATGAAEFIGVIAPTFMDNPADCQNILGTYIDQYPSFSYVAVLPLSGIVDCSSQATVIDFSGYPEFAASMERQEPTIIVNLDPPASQSSIFVISQPFFVEAEFAGFISISIPHSGLPHTRAELADQGLVELITFNKEGAVLTSRHALEIAPTEIPRDISLEDLADADAQSFTAVNMDGVGRRYTVVPIEGSPASIMAIWDVDATFSIDRVSAMQPAVFPMLMWLAGLGVAMLSLNTLVFRHLRRIREQMTAFAQNRQVDERLKGEAMPTELLEVKDNFLQMADKVVHDEAKLENALREKGVLVKEIHHRVKNNLQLITSIMNMQIREAEHDETREVLGRIQDRVLSLATIHRDLYQSEHSGRINVGALVSEIVKKSADVARAEESDLEITADIDDVLLFPDQAVPMSLLAAEALTNALKYVGTADNDAPWIKVCLTQTGTKCRLSFANSVSEHTAPEGTRLGSQLMNAFSIQLGAAMDVREHESSYSLEIAFDVQEFEPETRNY